MKMTRAEKDRAWVAAGGSFVDVRLSKASEDNLTAMTIKYGCSRRDVIEGLLLGTLTVASVANEMERQRLGMSEEEHRLFKEAV